MPSALSASAAKRLRDALDEQLSALGEAPFEGADEAAVAACAHAVLRAEADPVLRWLWRRAGTEAVELDGDRAVIGTLHQLLGAATE